MNDTQGRSIADIVAGLTSQTKLAAQESTPASATEVLKTAAENGAKDAATMLKFSAVIGDAIAERAAATFKGLIGYEGDVYKAASLQDMMIDSIVKVAEQISGTTINAEQASEKATAMQHGELAAHHANLAAQCASDAVQSLATGDEKSCGMMMQAATGHIEIAKQVAANVPHPTVQAHVGEAAQAVAEAANAIQAHAAGQA